MNICVLIACQCFRTQTKAVFFSSPLKIGHEVELRMLKLLTHLQAHISWALVSYLGLQPNPCSLFSVYFYVTAMKVGSLKKTTFLILEKSHHRILKNSDQSVNLKRLLLITFQA